VAVPLFNSIEYYCPHCQPHKIPKHPQQKLDELSKKKFGYEDNKTTNESCPTEILLPPEEGDLSD
jgi:hypothetical protein